MRLGGCKAVKAWLVEGLVPKWSQNGGTDLAVHFSFPPADRAEVNSKVSPYGTPPWLFKVGSVWRGSGYRMCKKPAVFVHSMPETCKTNGRGSRNAPLGGQSGFYGEGDCI